MEEERGRERELREWVEEREGKSGREGGGRRGRVRGRRATRSSQV